MSVECGVCGAMLRQDGLTGQTYCSSVKCRGRRLANADDFTLPVEMLATVPLVFGDPSPGFTYDNSPEPDSFSPLFDGGESGGGGGGDSW